MRRCRKPFNLCLFVVLTLSLNLLFILLVSPALAQYFTILRFHSDITVRQDSSFTVKETIDLKFDRPRHGIYREIPFKYVNELGGVTRTPIKVLSVTNESGKTWKHQVKREGAVIHIRIGDPKRYVNGNQTYVITYRVENALLFLNDHDELYWNVTGNAWKAPIQEASADVSLSIQKNSEKLWQGCYTGVYGSSESECDAETYESGGKFQTRRKLWTGEGFTIAFGWDKGLVSPPSSWRKFLWTLDLKENWVFLFPPLILVYMIFLWKRKGRDPKVKESITVQYEPPKFENRPLTPAEVGTLLDEKLDPRDITSTIVGLGVKGYLRIEEVKKEGWLSDSTDYYLKKIKDPDPELSPFEIELLRSLFPASLPGVLVSALKNKFYLHLDVLKKTLYAELIRKKYFTSNPERVRHSYAAVGFLVMVFGCLVFLFVVRDTVGKNIIAGILTGLPVIAFARFMPAKTRAGASAYMDILGFQEFMNRAEKDRLERIGDRDLFSKFLPYALALNVADSWAKAFEGIYQDPPDWYASPGGFRTFSPYGFTHSISSVTSDLSSAMFSAPRGGDGNGGGGGGSGGGGSSGGGFGGGGGGSW